MNRISQRKRGKLADNNPESNHDHDEEADKPFADNRDVINAIEALGGKYETAQGERSEHDTKTLFWTRTAGVGVLVYTGITALIMVASIASAIYSWRTLTEVQRAFITVSELKIEHVDSADGKVKLLRLTPAIKNTGTTPAVGVSLVLMNPLNDWTVAPFNLSPPIYFSLSGKIGAPRDPDELMDNSGASYLRKDFVIGPEGGSLTASGLSTDLPATSGFTAMQNGMGRFIYGSIHYFDVFDHPHLSKFCFRTDGIKMITTSNPDDIELRQDLCSHWNCTDGYCKADKQAYDSDWKNAVAERAKR
jgi:hypothetical protein